VSKRSRYASSGALNTNTGVITAGTTAAGNATNAVTRFPNPLYHSGGSGATNNHYDVGVPGASGAGAGVGGAGRAAWGVQQQHNQFQDEVGVGGVGIDAEYAVVAEQQYETVSEEFC
jgi:hypothetical protein